jgi:hypothetical protein
MGLTADVPCRFFSNISIWMVPQQIDSKSLLSFPPPRW